MKSKTGIEYKNYSTYNFSFKQALIINWTSKFSRRESIPNQIMEKCCLYKSEHVQKEHKQGIDQLTSLNLFGLMELVYYFCDCRFSISLVISFLFIMGSCVTQDPAKPQKNKDNDLTQTQPDSQLLEIPTHVLLRQRGKETKSGIRSDVSQNISTLKDRLMDQEQLQLEQWQKLHSCASSVILKRPNKKRGEYKNPQQPSQAVTSIVSELRGNENIDGNIIDQKDYSKLKIGTDMANIEFLLPKSRGGPLVVPYLLYQNYCPV